MLQNTSGSILGWIGIPCMKRALMKHIFLGVKDEGIKMKRKLFLIPIFALLATCFYSCGDFVLGSRIGFYIVNNADYPIGFYIADGGPYGTYYPDSLPETNDYIIYDIRNVIQPGIKIRHCPSWEAYFKDQPFDTLSVFIFHTDTLNKYSWEEVRDGYKILKRYDLGKDDLENMHHQLVYP